MSKLVDMNGRPIASEVRSRINDQAGDENLPNLTRAGNCTIELDARLDGSFRLSLVGSNQRADAVMSREDFARLIAEMLRAGKFR